jgi:hypothetical protein
MEIPLVTSDRKVLGAFPGIAMPMQGFSDEWTA